MITKIVYEDRDVLVVYKPSGIAVQSASVGTLDVVNEMKNYRAAKNESAYIGVINRIDQPVHGLVLLAKNKNAASKLTSQLNAGMIEKIYHASVYGEFEEKSGEMKDRLVKDMRINCSKVVTSGDINFKDSKEAILFYRELEPGELEVKLVTGRHHQIRVQLAHAGHPILGDRKYGTAQSEEESKAKGIKELALCAYSLSFKHPNTNEKLFFTADMAEDK